ncbi:hypothetical protein FA13DRAFT_1733457 [Coprinellus micaceus]|uniref:Hikeshi-like C-terminal domain-containing protein n=1 Tax=Coprinellus micaceus TaxID=71717 RepID=A0A4Y7T8W8_COPMI|nr:hypothetical protein FA13DRAFT_1733457 [Coprinellus micaceus]
MLSNDKPSAIFRLRGTFTSGMVGGGTGTAQGLFGGVGGGGGVNQDVTAVLGLAIEPLDVIASQVPNTSPPGAGALVKVPTPADTVMLAEKIVKHLFNYVSGFTGGGGEVAVPMSVVMKWYDSFVNKIRTSGGIGFLDRVE